MTGCARLSGKILIFIPPWKMNFEPAVTSALSYSTSAAAVRPSPLTTAPVPFRKKARSSRAAFQMPNDRRLSACGPATVVSLRLRSRRPSASASLSRSPNRRPKPESKRKLDRVQTCHNICAVFVTVRDVSVRVQSPRGLRVAVTHPSWCKSHFSFSPPSPCGCERRC